MQNTVNSKGRNGKIHTAAWLEKSERALLESIARVRRKSVSGAVREALLAYIEANKFASPIQQEIDALYARIDELSGRA